MVWIMSVARFLALAEILLLVWFIPGWIGSTGGALLIFAAGLAYTVFYVLAATRSRSGGGLLLHAVDIAAGRPVAFGGAHQRHSLLARLLYLMDRLGPDDMARP